MKTAKKVILTIGVLVICGFWCWGLMFVNYLAQDEIRLSIKAIHHRRHPFLTYAENWGIDIPEENAKIEYKYSNIVWLDGERYVVAKFSERPNELLQSFSDNMPENDWKRFNFAMDCLIKSEVDKSKVAQPDENSLFFVKRDMEDAIFLTYNQNTDMLYILVSYM